MRTGVASPSAWYFVERLTLRSWGRVMLPYLFRARQGWRGRARCLFIDGSRIGLMIARLCAPWTGVIVERLRFRLADIRDEHGFLIRWRVYYQDLMEVLAVAMEDPRFHAVAGGSGHGRLPTYLMKAMAIENPRNRRTLWRALLIVQICRWKMRMEGASGGAPVVFMERRPWFASITRYARRWGVTLVPLPPTWSARDWLRDHLPPELVGRARHRWGQFLWASRRLRRSFARRPQGSKALQSTQAAPEPGRPAARGRIAVEYWGHLNLQSADRYSNLFFWHQSSLQARDLLVLFHLPQDPLDEQKWAALQAHGIAALALHPRATTVSGVPVVWPHGRRQRSRTVASPIRSAPGELEARWLNEHVRYYWAQRVFWHELFASQGIKIYLFPIKMNETHCAIADALQDLGGVTAVYQRSYEHPSPDTAAAVDVMFGFSQGTAEVERRSGSRLRYLVITGYFGDYLFPGLRQRAQPLREHLQQQGARRLLAFCDENSRDDERWTLGHQLLRESYAFLLEKVLAEPWLGLVLKPKTPRTLRQRLGPVTSLLDRAQATGRCVLFEEGKIQGSDPPALAALASDVMVHGYLCSGTAGLECALAGVPTLLLDRAGMPSSPLYQLGVGRVVFTDWPMLWRACLDHWTHPGGVPGFGDWTVLLDEFDPFRDGRAAQRIGTYFQWLLEGFDAGLDRETVMADAAQRYAEAWGKQHISQGGWADAAAASQATAPPLEGIMV